MSRARDNANLSPTIPDARMPNLTGDVTTVEGAVATTIADDAVTGAKIENNPTIAGNLTVSGDLVPSTTLSNRNMIINGGMQVFQRHPYQSPITSTSGYFTADRWAIYEVSGATVTSEKHIMSVADLNTTGHGTALQLNCTVADTSVASGDYIFLRTSLEGQDIQRLQYGGANAKNITLSFWVKSDKAGIYSVIFVKPSTTRYHVVKEFTIDSADTWEKKTITVTPTEGSTSLMTAPGGIIDNTPTNGLSINFTLMVGDSHEATKDIWVNDANAWGTNDQVNWANETNNFYLTGVQLELGSNATPFEHRSYGDELARCQRYFYMIADGSIGSISTSTGQSTPIGIGAMYNDTTINLVLPFPVEMRTEPTIYEVGGTDYFKGYTNSTGFVFNAGWSIRKMSPTCGNISSTTGTGTGGDSVWIELDSQSAKLGFDAEL